VIQTEATIAPPINAKATMIPNENFNMALLLFNTDFVRSRRQIWMVKSRNSADRVDASNLGVNMNIESYRLKISPNGIIVVELEDEAKRQDDLASISKSLKELGASFVTKRVFALAASSSCSIEAIRAVFSGIFKNGDHAIMVSNQDQKLIATIIVPQKTGEGVVVRNK
jgi:hypothetical protein